MNKQELVSAIGAKIDVTKKDIENVVNSFVSTVQEALVNGEKVVIIGFGTFETKLRAKRVGRNPRDGSELIIPETNVPAFKAGKTFKDLVNGKNNSDS